MRVWALRVLWLALPLSAGAAASDALSGWDDAPKIAAAVLLWLAWGAGTLALLAPRPAGLTLLRTLAPAFAVLAGAALAAGDTGGVEGWSALVVTLATAALLMLPDFAVVAANGISYGDELRFPLRTPPTLFLFVLPVTRALVVAGAAAGPLLLADGEVLWGVIGLVAGIPCAVGGARRLHRLDRRWVVLVPAGFVVVDQMQLVDSLLVMRARLRTMRPIRGVDAPPSALDLRFGATTGNVLIELNEATEVMRKRRPGEAALEHGDVVLVAVAKREDLFDVASRRRLRVEFAATEARQTQ